MTECSFEEVRWITNLLALYKARAFTSKHSIAGESHKNSKLIQMEWRRQHTTGEMRVQIPLNARHK
jgi:hypothetical protein